MADSNRPLIYLVYEDLVNAVDGIGVKTFLSRPKVTAEELEDFIVIDIPTEIHGRIKGSLGVMAGCYGTFSVFCKAKSDSTLNIGKQGNIIQTVLDLFPINSEHVSATNPTILMQGYDGYGFQVTQITFNIRTKFNI